MLQAPLHTNKTIIAIKIKNETSVLWHEAIGAEDLMNLLKSDGYLLMGVRRHEAESDECVIGCNSRRNHWIHKDALIQQVARDGKRLVVVTDKQGNDRSLGVTNLTTHITEALQCLVGEFPQVLLALGLGNEDINSLHRCGS